MPSILGFNDRAAKTAAAATPTADPPSRAPSRYVATVVAEVVRMRPVRIPAGVWPKTARIKA